MSSVMGMNPRALVTALDAAFVAEQQCFSLVLGEQSLPAAECERHTAAVEAGELDDRVTCQPFGHPCAGHHIQICTDENSAVFAAVVHAQAIQRGVFVDRYATVWSCAVTFVADRQGRVPDRETCSSDSHPSRK
ncbi:hypothetical protein GCM10027169_07040 [Gordonia jinhuaensis]|uniref:Uncharacterized protein n=1 Tax=Gordonia jinhuaensis TaxID=1517702 RepID=A0A916SXA1_9ACTN|nr:hypothetical protein GCM10011489_06640 [Gordonia jinhuaensis]